MINKRLLSLNRDAMKYVGWHVFFNWLALLCNVVFIVCLGYTLGFLLNDQPLQGLLQITIPLSLIAILVRYIAVTKAASMSHQASHQVKAKLRHLIYEKVLVLGLAYRESVSTSELVMLASEGVEQLDIYFSRYLPQFFYSILAPLTLFVLLAPLYLPSALVLLACVPLIPLSIIVVQKFAKRLLADYWDEYANLGDGFLENLQGLTTLKIYQADAFKNEEMNQQAERFRKITMRVLTMQLNSVTLMDLIAYGGGALGIITAVLGLASGQLSFIGSFIIILLAADFFIPLRLLGSYFHIAMNGAASAEKIFRLLDATEKEDGKKVMGAIDKGLLLDQVSFAYEAQRPILNEVSLEFPKGSFTAIVGESGSGKSTMAGLLFKAIKPIGGSVRLNDTLFKEFSQESLMKAITLVPHDAVLFKGTVAENLKIAAGDASEQALWEVLKQVNLADFFKTAEGLQTLINENASNLSGGQRQRLAMARALLHDSPIYIFDEATSNIDRESETSIMRIIRRLAKTKTVILISHRLANVVDSDNIYCLNKGRVVESGTHQQMMAKAGTYHSLFTAQEQLEAYGEDQ